LLHHKEGPTLITDKSAILVVPNVIGRMEAQLSIPPLSLQDLIRESFTFFQRTF